jgi:hypothetical protein
VTASNLGEREQLSLFEAAEPRKRRAVEAADVVRRRYGERSITRARLLGTGLPAPFERDPRNPSDRRARGLETDAADEAAAAGAPDDDVDVPVDDDTLAVTGEDEIPASEA